MTQYEYELLNKSHIEGVFEHLQNSFRVDAPLIGSLALESEETREWFREVVEQAVTDGISFVAVDSSNGTIAGCRLSSMAKRSDCHKPTTSTVNYPKKMSQILAIIGKLFGNIFDLLPTDAEKVFSFVILSVDRKYRRIGIARKLVDLSLGLARDQDFDYVTTITTSSITQQLYEEKYGFKTFRQLAIKEYETEDGEKLFQNASEDLEFAKIQVLNLKN